MGLGAGAWPKLTPGSRHSQLALRVVWGPTHDPWSPAPHHILWGCGSLSGAEGSHVPGDPRKTGSGEELRGQSIGSFARNGLATQDTRLEPEPRFLKGFPV